MTKTHLRDIRLRNNAGMDFPTCKARAKLLDLSRSSLPMTGDIERVTCRACKREAARSYDWAYRAPLNAGTVR